MEQFEKAASSYSEHISRSGLQAERVHEMKLLREMDIYG